MSIAQLLSSHVKDLGGGFMVHRLLPAAQRQSVGPFVFFDHFGPVRLPAESNTDVRPHPHIGLATVTYLFEGAMMHRDSLGCVQRIEPGAINWMVAGRGIVHSERTPDDLRGRERPIHGLQLWVALPQPQAEAVPGFFHTPAAEIPQWQDGHASCRLLVGSAYGRVSPVRTNSPTLYLDVELRAGGRFVLAPIAAERAIYSVDGPVVVDGQQLEPRQLAVLAPDATAEIRTEVDAHFVVIGGEPLDGHRFIWWNFVASSRERIEQAKADWTGQRMGSIPGETDFIPLP